MLELHSRVGFSVYLLFLSSSSSSSSGPNANAASHDTRDSDGSSYANIVCSKLSLSSN
jgi:hypothetical protein